MILIILSSYYDVFPVILFKELLGVYGLQTLGQVSLNDNKLY